LWFFIVYSFSLYFVNTAVSCIVADAVNAAVVRMHDMADQITRLTETQQLYQDAVSLKERELSV